MKKLSIIMMLVLAVMMLGATVASAATNYLELGFVDTPGVYYGENVLAVSGSASSWTADFTAQAGLTSKTSGQIIGLFDGDIWQASYSTDGGSTYTPLATLIAGWTNPVNIKSDAYYDELIGAAINANITHMKLAYNFELVSGIASGTANFDLTPVPEPSGILALLAGLTGIAGVVVRRKA